MNFKTQTTDCAVSVDFTLVSFGAYKLANLNNSDLTHWLAVDINSQVIAGGLSREHAASAALYTDALDWTVERATEAAYHHWLNDGPDHDLDFLDGVYLRT